MTCLVEMMNVENNLHLDIILKNITTNETFKFEDYDLEKITHAPSKFSIESMQFNLASAIIFIGLYHQEDVQDIMKAYPPDAKINTLYLSVAAMIIIICLYLIFVIQDQY